MTNIKFASAALILALASGTAFAAGMEEEAQAPSTAFEQLDTNQDGLISKEEGAVREDLTTLWEAADANKDGSLDAAEFSAFETTVPAQQ
jgi:Ca2+-binding EF-hand superfamily protein